MLECLDHVVCFKITQVQCMKADNMDWDSKTKLHFSPDYPVALDEQEDLADEHEGHSKIESLFQFQLHDTGGD